MPELPAPGRPPRLSIITTVYDRAACLEFCLAAVSRLHVRDYEHLVVADHPPDDIAARLARLVQEQDDPRVTFHNLPRRADDFGITPAAHGLALARGDYVAFLDDDNAWLPQHFDALLDCLEREPGLGFV